MIGRLKWCLCALPVLLIMACDRTPRPESVDSTTGSPDSARDSVAVDATRSGWEETLGPLLVIAGAQSEASAIFPHFSDSTLTDTTTFDTSVIDGMRVDLFSRAGLAGRGQLRPAPARPRDDGCVAWPEVVVTVTEPRGRRPGWTVAFAEGRVTAIVLDSLENQTGADSARLTAEVSRLASVVPSDTAAAFRGIPYFVRQVWRSRTAPDTALLIANVTRRINQEANPREEQLLLVAERIASRPDGRYSVVYHERVSGEEEAIESTDVLAAVALRSGGAPVVVLIRDYGDGSAYALLTRAPVGEWRLAWNSAYAGC